MPGPDVFVKARAPAHPAPITMPAADSSSSAWMMQYRASPVSASVLKLLAERHERFHQRCRWRDRIPCANRRTRVDGAERGGGVAVNDDRVAGGIHALEMKRQRTREMCLGVIETQLDGTMLFASSSAFFFENFSDQHLRQRYPCRFREAPRARRRRQCCEAACDRDRPRKFSTHMRPKGMPRIVMPSRTSSGSSGQVESYSR